MRWVLLGVVLVELGLIATAPASVPTPADYVRER